MAYVQSVNLEHLWRGSLKMELLVLAKSIFSDSEDMSDFCREQMRAIMYIQGGNVQKDVAHHSGENVMCAEDYTRNEEYRVCKEIERRMEGISKLLITHAHLTHYIMRNTCLQS